MFKQLIFLSFLGFAVCATQYWACDSAWGNQTIGTSNGTTCKKGDILTSLAMILSNYSQFNKFNPKTLNAWFMNNNGYNKDNSIVWTSLRQLGFVYLGIMTNFTEIQNLLNVPYSNPSSSCVFWANIGTSHWVFARYAQDKLIRIYDPLQVNDFLMDGEVIGAICYKKFQSQSLNLKNLWSLMHTEYD